MATDPGRIATCTREVIADLKDQDDDGVGWSTPGCDGVQALERQPLGQPWAMTRVGVKVTITRSSSSWSCMAAGSTP